MWGLHAQQEATSRKEALEAKAAEHLNLASITAENLRQLVDRAQVIGRITQSEVGGLSLDGRSMIRLLAEDPVLKRISLYDATGLLLSSSHADEIRQLPEQWLLELHEHRALYGPKPYLPRLLAQDASSPNWRLPFVLPLSNPAT